MSTHTSYMMVPSQRRPYASADLLIPFPGTYPFPWLVLTLSSNADAPSASFSAHSSSYSRDKLNSSHMKQDIMLLVSALYPRNWSRKRPLNSAMKVTRTEKGPASGTSCSISPSRVGSPRATSMEMVGKGFQAHSTISTPVRDSRM